MKLPAMQSTTINGVALEVWDRGSGEPVVFVHGAMGDECYAVLAEPALADQYRLIHYHRRGWGNSQRLQAPISIEQQATDCRAIMQELGVERAHLVGQSYGGVILLQMALDYSNAVHTLALLEPALPSVLLNKPEIAATFEVAESLYQAGDKTGAMTVFGQEVCGPDFRTVFDQTLPPDYLERWGADAETHLHRDSPALGEWTFTSEVAARITQPVLNIVGTATKSYFQEIHELLKTWLPHAENFVLPDATHCMLQMNPKGAAERLASFFSRHPIRNGGA